MSSTNLHEGEWHVRRQRVDARTTLVSIIDASADRITIRQFLDQLEASEAFRDLFFTALLECGLETFVWEMPAITRTRLGSELELAVTEVAMPETPKKKRKLDPERIGAEVRSDEQVVVLPSPDGEATLVVPCAREAEAWYAELGIFLRRVRRAQAHALFRELARATKAALGSSEKLWLGSSSPGAPWLTLRIATSPKDVVFSRYAR